MHKLSSPDKVLEWTTTRDLKKPLDPPSSFLDAQRSEEPVRKVRIWDESEPWLILTYDDYRLLLNDQRVSADRSRQGFPLKNAGYVAKKPTMLSLDGAAHLPFRRLFAKHLSAPRMEKLRPGIQALVDHHIDEMLAGPKPVDFVEAFALRLPLEVLGEVFGIPAEDRGSFIDLSLTMSSRTSTPEEAAAAISQLREFTEDLIRQRQEAPQDDFISNLVIDGYQTGIMSWEELVAELTLLIGAAHDTSQAVISLGLLALLNHPDQLELLIANSDDPKFVANATEELLRFTAPTQTGRRRTAIEDIELTDGTLIKAGDGIVALDDVSSRDPAVFPDPDQLILTRTEARRHNALGFGPHQCAGQSLARVELQVVFGTLFKRIPTLRLAVPESDLPFRWDTIIHIIDEIQVTW